MKVKPPFRTQAVKSFKGEGTGKMNEGGDGAKGGRIANDRGS